MWKWLWWRVGACLQIVKRRSGSLLVLLRCCITFKTQLVAIVDILNTFIWFWRRRTEFSWLRKCTQYVACTSSCFRKLWRFLRTWLELLSMILWLVVLGSLQEPKLYFAHLPGCLEQFSFAALRFVCVFPQDGIKVSPFGEQRITK